MVQAYDVPEGAACPKCRDDRPAVAGVETTHARVWRWFAFHDVVVITTSLRCVWCGHVWTHRETRPAESIR